VRASVLVLGTCASTQITLSGNLISLGTLKNMSSSSQFIKKKKKKKKGGGRQKERRYKCGAKTELHTT
jgi:hypothetical protein